MAVGWGDALVAASVVIASWGRDRRPRRTTGIAPGKQWRTVGGVDRGNRGGSGVLGS